MVPCNTLVWRTGLALRHAYVMHDALYCVQPVHPCSPFVATQCLCMRAFGEFGSKRLDV